MNKFKDRLFLFLLKEKIKQFDKESQCLLNRIVCPSFPDIQDESSITKFHSAKEKHKAAVKLLEQLK